MLGKPDKARELEEIPGTLSQQEEEDKLMNTVIEGQKEKEAKIIMNALNHGIFAFNPDMMFEQIVNNYQEAKDLYGNGFLKSLDISERDINFPEVHKKLKDKLIEEIEKLQEAGFIDSDNSITEKGLTIAALSMYVEELESLESRGLIGIKTNKRLSHYGDRESIREYKRGDRYRDIAIKNSIHHAIRHNHNKLKKEDLMVHSRKSKGGIEIIYGIDASGSMKGKKIEACKKAGIALAFKAINEHDKVGLIVFGANIETSISPTNNFIELLHSITRVRAKNKTNLRDGIMKCIELFSSEDTTKHLILITDAVPTHGEDPKKETLLAVDSARNSGINISVIGIKLDKEGEELAKDITRIGDGRLYLLHELNGIDEIVLTDYYKSSYT
ncbi:MAG: VWA domain-containing protein [Nanoarchaeota archaeon]